MYCGGTGRRDSLDQASGILGASPGRASEFIVSLLCSILGVLIQKMKIVCLYGPNSVVLWLL